MGIHKAIHLILVLVTISTIARAEPLLSSWYFGRTGRYALLYATTADETAGIASSTWSRGVGVQSQPTYPGVHEVSYSADWAYVRTTGLGSHIMGPWYLDVAKTQLFPNFPANSATIYRFPRTPPSPPATQALTSLGTIGYFVDGVAMFDSRDAFSYSNADGTDSTPMNGITGDGIWNRDAYVNESVSFDAGFAHQAGFLYHYHVNPPALRYQLGGHVEYNSVSNRYTAKSGTPAWHSPLIGWVSDGYPIYGPYGYSDSLNSASSMRLISSGYRARSIANRQVLPAWAARAQGFTGAGNTNEHTLNPSQYGPNVNPTYPVGHYTEDYEYLGDFGQVQGTDFDLDEHNGRFCVTPEFPAGTYAYFTCITSNGTPQYPYNVGRAYYGNPTGSTVNEINESVSVYAEGGPGKTLEFTRVGLQGNDLVLVYSSIEGGMYNIYCTSDLTSSNWTHIATNISSVTESRTYVVSNALQGSTGQFYRVALTNITAFDDTGFDYDLGGAVPTDPGVYPD